MTTGQIPLTLSLPWRHFKKRHKSEQFKSSLYRFQTLKGFQSKINAQPICVLFIDYKDSVF